MRRDSARSASGPGYHLRREIRDGETAEIATRAMTGHLVITTVHTEDAISAIDRLRDMGVPPYLIAAGLRGVISQRL
ncbi:MAG: ATPase, T2SS/T4P/T4SS family [Lachnospiraceae bacterium]